MKNGIASSGKLSAPSRNFCENDRGVELPLRDHQRERAHQQRKGDRHAQRHRTEQ